MKNQFSLMRERRFRPFFLTQFLGAFNDNVFKIALMTLVTFHAVDLGLADAQAKTLETVLPGLFILPFFLFSATAGQLADKFEKSQIMRYVKLFEIAIMLFASAGFFFHNIWFLAAGIFMMGMHSTIFGPVKYSYLPQHLQEKELIGGNGLVEMGTFVAILLGEVLGVWLAKQLERELFISISILAIALLGYWVSRGVPNSPAASPQLKINWNPLTETFRSIQFIWQHQVIWLAIIAISWFWFFGATLLGKFPSFAKEVLYGDESIYILLLSVFSVGIGIGSMMCEKLSKGKVELGLVMFGGLGLTLFGADLYFSSSTLHASMHSKTLLDYVAFVSPHYDAQGHLILTFWRLLIDLAMIGFFGGLYIVPLYALIQTRSEKSHQSRVIAANNIMNALFMVGSAVFSIYILNLKFSIPALFLSTALLNIVVLAYLCVRQPEYFKTFVAWVRT